MVDLLPKLPVDLKVEHKPFIFTSPSQAPRLLYTGDLQRFRLRSVRSQHVQQILFTPLLPRNNYLTHPGTLSQLQTQGRPGERGRLSFEQLEKILKFLERAELSGKEKEL